MIAGWVRSAVSAFLDVLAAVHPVARPFVLAGAFAAVVTAAVTASDHLGPPGFVVVLFLGFGVWMGLVEATGRSDP